MFWINLHDPDQELCRNLMNVNCCLQNNKAFSRIQFPKYQVNTVAKGTSWNKYVQFIYKFQISVTFNKLLYLH